MLRIEKCQYKDSRLRQQRRVNYRLMDGEKCIAAFEDRDAYWIGGYRRYDSFILVRSMDAVPEGETFIPMVSEPTPESREDRMRRALVEKFGKAPVEAF